MTDLSHGQVWWADLPQGKVRPVVILTRGNVAPLLHRVIVAPVTTTSRGIASEVSLGSTEGVKEGSVANLDNAQLLDVDLLVGLAGEVEEWRWPEFCDAMGHVIGCRRV
jgi:mRNA interferase MazF